ncbi:glycosyltransferase family protein [Sulfobacillus thermosulfidooxidans]|uniref:glycosyltransferase family protein n=1 Tax=Sulfobacillus thermosulfidooxidans TaxID=28034 RepID=UPI00096BAC7E|nr:glycosyltransferase [Sulfobacillus thermosulfidooxidans]OLZ11747.1 hypothetical protein BFX05_07085 [Sulfobacillus thermosulfidooxidans]OLZ18710.1 hypothetical protein BFX06_00680 [Sulfobacillus thermosulfidooxidans]OLZ20211.1 hypothetical protein BFX07_01120 [Sulfobacillus thermosulfidooxidans]
MRPLLTATDNFRPDPKFRVGLIFDDRLRKDTTGGYCLKYLSNLCHVVHISPNNLHLVNKEDFDLFLHIDDGLDYTIPNTLYPRAWWVIDTHLNLSRDIERAYFYDWVFAAQKNGAEALRQAGIINVWWMPLAGDPRNFESNFHKTLDWSFVGYWSGTVYGEREQILNAVKDIGDNFIGQASPDDMYKIYERSRIVLNPPIRDDINMRVFEAMAAGAILLTKKSLTANGMDELFEEGIDYLIYESVEDVRAVLIKALNLPEMEQQEIINNARRKALSRDSYGHRMQALLETVHRIPGIQAQYFRHVRNEILALIPKSAQSVLDIGCATGKLGEFLKQRQNCRVSGIELHPQVAKEAEKVLDNVYVGDAEKILPEIPNKSFDCIVLADVLEHIEDPWAFLRQVGEKLKNSADARIVLSIPNASHWSVVLPLIQGEWKYADSGILDSTHLRFFTPQSIVRLIRGAELDIETMQGTVLSRPNTLMLREEGILKNWLEGGLADLYQILCVCKKKNVFTESMEINAMSPSV